MHIAFLHNLQTCLTPEQAEFDTPETVAAIVAALQALGHRVSTVDAGMGVGPLVIRLEALSPDLVLNTAEGTIGRFREGFYPGLLEQLGIPYTGSDAYVCNLTLDKNLTKLALADRGVRVPASCFVTKKSELKPLNFPVIAKPNFEGSSKGITQESIARDQSALEALVERLLAEYPSGLLVEEFIEGRDVTVPYLEKVGVLEPAHYVFGGEEREFSIYDYELKQHRPDDVQVVCPAEVPSSARKTLMEYTKKAVKFLGVRDFGRVDYRVTPSGEVFLIEVNALPSLEPGAAIYLGAAAHGLKTVESVLDAIVGSAKKRLPKVRGPRGKKRLRVGLCYNVKKGPVGLEADSEAEFDAPTTIEALLQAIGSNGYEAVPLEATPELPARLGDIDLVFNIAEGLQGRHRESQVPALLELLGIPYTGSDAGALAVTLDKALAKRLVRQAGVSTAEFAVMRTGKEKRPAGMEFPLFVKPLAEGSSKGILPNCLVRDAQQLQQAVTDIVERYHQPALVETFLSGREFTVGLLGERKLRMLPPMEILFGEGNTERIYAFEHKLDDNSQVSFKVPADVDSKLYRQLERCAKGAFRALGCRDVARVDLRLDSQGVVHFIECNPLPGLTPNFSDLCVIASAAGLDYNRLVGEILAPAVKRWKVAQRA